MKFPMGFVLTAMLFLMSGRAQAEKKPLEDRFFYRPVRIGLCGGFSPECQLGSTKFEFSTKYVGINFHIGVIPVWVGTTLKTYPTPIYNVNKTTFRPYVFYGAGAVFMASAITGGGVGTDIHFLESKRLLLQPAIAVFNQTFSQPMGPNRAPEKSRVTAGGSLSVMAAF